MPISPNNIRIVITISKKLNQELKLFAKKDSRTVSNLCEKVLSDFLKEKGVDNY